MKWHKTTLDISTHGKGLYDLTARLQAQLDAWGADEGLCVLFLPHTSASLTLNENWDPTARADLEAWMERAVPAGQDWFTHTLEGADDATSHIRAMLTGHSLTIPIEGGKLTLGTWQGVYLFEHRARPHRRRLLVRLLAV